MKTWIVLFVMLLAGTATADYVQTLTTTRGGTGSASQSASKAVTTDGSGDIVSSSATTSTQIGYLSTLSSDVQTQLNGKSDVALDNLVAVAINTSLLPASAGSAALGSSSLPFSAGWVDGLDLYATGTTAVVIQAQSGTSSWTIQPPVAACGSGQYWADNGSGVYSCATPASMGANVELSNLSAVAINTSLLPASAGSASIGSASNPFSADYEEALELYSTSSVAVTIEAQSGTTAWTIQPPTAACSNGQVWEDNGSGVYSCASVAMQAWTVSNGGDTAYSIPSTYNLHVRSGTTLTAQRTYTLPVCSTNIGMEIDVKNLPSQSFDIILAGNGSDTLDGDANMTLEPGDDQTVICSVSGNWDEK